MKMQLYDIIIIFIFRREISRLVRLDVICGKGTRISSIEFFTEVIYVSSVRGSRGHQLLLIVSDIKGQCMDFVNVKGTIDLVFLLFTLLFLANE